MLGDSDSCVAEMLQPLTMFSVQPFQKDPAQPLQARFGQW